MTSNQASEVVPVESPLAPRKRRRRKPRENAKPKQQSPYAVILHNDDVNGFEYVISVLRKVFNYDFAMAFKLTLQAHVTGKSIVWSGILEVAELKADQIRSCGPDPNMRERGALPLRVSVEPLPG